MVSDWPEISIDDLKAPTKGAIAMGPFGSRIKAENFVKDGVPIIKGAQLHGAYVLDSNFDYLTEEKAEELKSSQAFRGDLVITHRGTVGQVSIIPHNSKYKKYIVSQSQLKVSLNLEVANPYFVNYFFRSHIGQHRLLVNASQVGVPAIAKASTSVKAILVPCPSLNEQNKIVGLLRSFDDKIELNRQMNATLEALAQALFKSWFVDFDPVIDNALAAANPIPEPLQARAATRQALGEQRKPLPETIRQQFPCRFEFSEEMGWIPEGWAIGCFGDVSQQVRKNVKVENISEFDFYVGLEHISKKQLFLADNGTGETIGSNKSGFKENDLLFGKLRPYFHKVCLAPVQGICSTDILVFRAKCREFHSYMILTAFTDAFVEYANIRSTGTRMPRASAKDMLAYSICIPPVSVLSSFDGMVKPMWKKGMESIENNRALSKARDTLLPKLLSGELRIPDAEKLVANAR